MTTIFLQSGSHWTFRVKIKTVSGIRYVIPYALWETREEVEGVVPLFVWYKGRKDVTQPSTPLPHGHWLKTA